MTDNTTLAVVGGLALGGLALATGMIDGGSGASDGGANQQSGGLDPTADPEVRDPATNQDTENTPDTLSEFDASEDGDLFGVTGSIDENLGGDTGTVSPDAPERGGLTPYEQELLDTDTDE